MRRLFASLVLSAALATSAVAHQPRIGANGGPLVDAGVHFHAELVAKGTADVVVFLYDAHDKPIASAGFKAHAILVVEDKPQRFTLEPAEGSRLVGTAPVAIPAGTKGALQLTAPDGATAQAKF